MQTTWEHRYAQRALRMKSSVIREILKLAETPDVISFAGGMPAPEIFPFQRVEEACDYVIKTYGQRALQYGPTEGYVPLRKLIAEYGLDFGIDVDINNILITSGSQQALDLIGKMFINPGDSILVESPTYLGALQAWDAYEAKYITIPSDENGMMTDYLEEALRKGPKFIYALPNFQNPTGVSISLERRRIIVELADKYGVPIIEDDPYGALRFEGDHLPSLLAVDAEYRNMPKENYKGNVLYLSTFSKIMAPGLRLAWVVGPVEVINKMVQAKQGSDLQTSTFTQFVAYEVGKENFLQNHIKHIQKVYHERRDVMLDSLEEHMPKGVQWTHPGGGLFLWITLPEHEDSVEVFKLAVEQKVAFVPGESFHPNGGGKNTMRLNFSNAGPARINEGISRLGATLHARMKK